MKLTLRVIAILSFIIAIAWMFYSPGFEPLLAFFAGITTLILSFVGGEKETETLDQRNRRILLNHVENFWVKGVLEKSLHGAAMLELGIKEDPAAVTYPWAIKKEATDEILPAGTSMLEIFEQIGMGRSLLILGAPGSGKTTMLLELARQLIERARQNADEPIPMVFNLASWTEKLSLADWLAQELNNIYYVPRKAAPDWVKGNKLLLLLDGLDEVRQESRAKCVDAINQFRKEHGLTSLAVCSRSQDYEELGAKLAFEGAIEVQPLTQKQVNEFFKRFGKEMAGLKSVLKKDSALREMAETPLFLSVMVIAYKNKRDVEVLVLGDEKARRKHLFDTYIARMFDRTEHSPQPSYPIQDFLHWLSWLANRMIEHNQIPFLVERMQPDWLDKKEELLQRRVVGRILRLITGMIIGLMVEQIFGWTIGLIAGLMFVLIFEVIGKLRLIQGLAEEPDNRNILVSLLKIETVDRLNWSPTKGFPGLRLGFIFGLLGSGLIFGLSLVRTNGVAGLIATLIVGLIFGLFSGLMFLMVGGLDKETIDQSKIPGQKITYSIKNSLASFLIVALIFEMFSGLAFGLIFGIGGRFMNGLLNGLVNGLSMGLILGLIFGIQFGGFAVINHYSLRFSLAKNNCIPWKLVPFLDYCTDLIFLRRVGGGYIFVHRLLMEHFAAMYKD